MTRRPDILITMALFVAAVISGCATSGGYRVVHSTEELSSIQEKYSSELSKLEVGMNLEDFRRILPDAQPVGSYEHTGAYQLVDVQVYVTQGDIDFQNSNWLFGSPKPRTIKRVLSFYFSADKLVKWGKPKDGDGEPLLEQEVATFSEKCALLNSRAIDFEKGLSDEELEVYVKIGSQGPVSHAAAELNRRQLYKVMSQEHWGMLEQILEEATNLETEKAMLVQKIYAHDQAVATYNQEVVAQAQAAAVREQQRRETLQAVGRAFEKYSEQEEQRRRQQAQWVQQENQRLELHGINTNLAAINNTLRGR